MARRLFSSAEIGSTGSVRTASDNSPLLNRTNALLPSKEVYVAFVDHMETLLLKGSAAYPHTFTEEFTQKVRIKNEILYRVYEEQDIDQDSPHFGGAITEKFLNRFQGDTDEYLMTPQTKLEWSVYEALFEILDLDMSRVMTVLRARPGADPGWGSTTARCTRK